jgi:hypothetical protein
MLIIILTGVLGLGLSAFTYLVLERLGRRSWPALLCRAVAWTALGLLVVNLGCPVQGAPRRPLVLLDASLSLGTAGGRWPEARDSASRWGEVRTFGDERAGPDSLPVRGRSLLAPALLAAAASDRPVIVVSDGEIEDEREIPPDILSRTGVRLFPRDQRPDLAISRLTGPSRVSAGDSIPLEALVQSSGEQNPDTVTVQVTAGTTRLGRRVVRLREEGGGRARILVPSAALPAGDHVIRVSLVHRGDPEPRTDSRLHVLTITPTPGVVFLAGPADWDSRFLFRTLREVSQLPVRGFVRLERERWRSMTDLRPVPSEQVRRAARQADLLILKGGVEAIRAGSRARSVWRWPSGEYGQAPVPGDWYLTVGATSPLAGAFLGQPVDSFPPAIQLAPIRPKAGAWTALSAQLGRRGQQRPAVFGGQDGNVREVTVAADGLWRWAFRGGSSEQSYRSWVAATVSWLLGGVDSAQGKAHPLQSVVPNGRPMVFQWLGAGPAVPVSIQWSGARESADSLQFDGNGRAITWLAPGEYRYQLDGGGAGTVVVEAYSDEFLQRPVSLTAQEPRLTPPGGRSSSRDWLWLFGLCVLALSGEWFARRRLGLR